MKKKNLFRACTIALISAMGMTTAVAQNRKDEQKAKADTTKVAPKAGETANVMLNDSNENGCLLDTSTSPRA